MGLFYRFRKKKSTGKIDESAPTPDGVHNVSAAPETPQQIAPPPKPPEGPIDPKSVRTEIVKALKTVYDPEIPVDIYELGLIYEIQVEEDGNTYIKMTLTAPNCPAAGILPGQIESKARGVDGVYDVKLDLVFDPPWSMDRMSEAAKLELGML